MKRLQNSLVIGILFLLSWSCGSSSGYGLVLWSDNEIELATGMVVRIVSESYRRDIFRVEHPDTKAIIELDTWRIAQFDNRQQAQNYLKEYAPFLRTYVDVRRSALPMREEPRTSARSIYSLREGQVLKVLGRSLEREQIGGYKAYWYHILSSDGVQGWTYGRFLREYVLSESGQALYDQRDYTGDAILENFFDPENIWRPAQLYDMVRNGVVDLAWAKEEYGLFINPESKVINISLPDQEVSFTYSRITPVGGDAYMFVDSPFSFTLKPNLVAARYALRGRNYSVNFRVLEQDIATIIRDEESRRGELYTKFMQLGPSFDSDLVSLTLLGGNRFSFADTQRMQQLQILQAGDGLEGTMVFDLMLDAGVASEYDGAFSLIMQASGKRVSFAYRLGPNGFEATWLSSTPSSKLVLPIHLSSVATIFIR